jgi:hypothetical protein
MRIKNTRCPPHCPSAAADPIPQSINKSDVVYVETKPLIVFGLWLNKNMFPSPLTAVVVFVCSFNGHHHLQTYD